MRCSFPARKNRPRKGPVRRFMSVSYTHLDVYKRQASAGAAEGSTAVCTARSRSCFLAAPVTSMPCAAAKLRSSVTVISSLSLIHISHRRAQRVLGVDMYPLAGACSAGVGRHLNLPLNVIGSECICREVEVRFYRVKLHFSSENREDYNG